MKRYEIIQQNRQDIYPLAIKTYIRQIENSNNNNTVLKNYGKITNVDPLQDVIINTDNDNNIYLMGYGYCDSNLYDINKPLVVYNQNCDVHQFNPCKNLNIFVYLIKLSSNFDFKWKYIIGGIDCINTVNFTIFDNNIYISGDFSNTIEIYNCDNIVAKIHNNCQQSSLFVANINIYGVFGWVNYINSPSRVTLSDIFTDGNDIYISGNFGKEMIFYDYDNNYQATLKSNFSNNAFLIKYTKSGSLVWVLYFYDAIPLSSQEITINSISVSNNIYIMGTFITSEIYANLFVNNISNTNTQIYSISKSNKLLSGFVLSMNKNGEINYSFLISDLTSQNFSIISTNYIFYIVYQNISDTIIAKYNNLGTKIWESKIVNSIFTTNSSIAIDNFDNIAIITKTLGENAIIYNSDNTRGPIIIAKNSTTSFITRINSDGNILWATRQVGVSQNNFDISIGKYGNIYIIGTFGSENLQIYDANGILTNTINTSGYENTFIINYVEYSQILFLPIIIYPDFEKSIILDQSNFTLTAIYPKYDVEIYYLNKKVKCIILSQYSEFVVTSTSYGWIVKNIKNTQIIYQ